MPHTGTVDPRDVFSPAEQALIDAYQSAVVPPVVLGLIVGLVVSLAIGFTPVGARLVATLTFRGHPYVTAALAAATVVLVGRIAVAPFDIRIAVVRRNAGLLVQPWSAWTLDYLKSLAITEVSTVLAIVLMLVLIRRIRLWFIPAALIAGGSVIAISFAYPLVIEPMFIQTTPMAASALRTDLLQMAARDGVDVSEVLVADASSRTTALNAYVSGFGASRRIVVFDTLLSSNPKEVEMVVAHELGHAKSGDVLTGTLLGAVGVAGAVLLLGWILTWTRVLSKLGIPERGDPKVVPFVLAVVAVLTIVSMPVTNAVSRHIEAAADLHALELTNDPATMIAMQHSLAMSNLSALNPSAWRYWIFFSHPSTSERIEMALEF